MTSGSWGQQLGGGGVILRCGLVSAEVLPGGGERKLDLQKQRDTKIGKAEMQFYKNFWAH